MIVVGKVSVKAILENKKRSVSKVYLLHNKKDKEARYIRSLIKANIIEEVDRETLDSLTQTTSHGGYAIECDSRISDRLEDLPQGHLKLMCVEGVSDPYNMGEICRTLGAFGFDGLVTPFYNFYEHEAKLIRASAGASERLLWIQSDDLEHDLEELTKTEVVLVSAYRGEQSLSLQDYQFPKRFCLCVGGAYRGLSQKVLSLSQDCVRIDYDARIALSTVSACTAFAYAVFSQKEDEL